MPARPKETDPVLQLIRKVNNSHGLEQASAAKRLADLGDPRAAEVMVSWLNESYPLLYEQVVRGVQKLGGAAMRQFFPIQPKYVGVFFQNIIIALEKIGDADAIELLISLLAYPNEDDAKRAMHALYSIGISAVPALVSALKSPDRQTRKLATTTLRNLQSPDSIDGLVTAVLNTTEEEEVSNLAFALGYFGDYLKDNALVWIKDADWRLQLVAFSIASRVKDERALPDLLKTFTGEDTKMRIKATVSLVGYGKPVVPHLIEHVKHKDPMVRILSVTALGMIGDRESIPALGDACCDPRKSVRAEALAAISEIGDPVAIPFVLKALENDSRVTRMDALAKLRNFKKRAYFNRPADVDWESVPWNEIEEAVRPLLSDHFEEVREKAKETLATFEKPLS